MFHMKPVETRMAGVSRVSPATPSQTRSSTQTVFLPVFALFFFFFLSKSKNQHPKNWAKSKLAQVEQMFTLALVHQSPSLMARLKGKTPTLANPILSNVGPRRVGGPKFRVFFFPFPLQFCSFCLFLAVFSWNLVVFEGRDPRVHVWSSRADVVKPQWPRSRPAGFHTTTQKAQTCTFEGPGLQTTPKFNENSLREREKERKDKTGWEREKKKRNFGRSGGGGSGGGGEGQKKTNNTQQHTTAHNSTQQGNFKDVRVSLHPKFSSILADPTFSAVGSTFLAEEEAQKC